ncbi:unnamed protein product [Mytilus edulis]|uniref:B box-type domain-containing protein n=1 Tax=Mytilus edulis TaxID=6550 RepID=A0A8S3UFB2_MYTED|nr:unnamed protein product [Mytilus edulis]
MVLQIFPKDNTRRDLTSFLQTHSDRNAFKKCCGCGHTVDINYECQQCALNLCEMCRQQHIAENKTHSFVVSNSETFQGKEENLNICPIPHHERAKFKYFCNSANCQSVLCPFCALDEHRDINKHEIEDIEEAFKRKKKQLGRLIEFIQSKILNVESILQNVKDNMFTLKYDRNEFQKQLDDMCNRGILVLQNRRQIILDKYDFSLQRKEFKANLRNDTLRIFLENANACCYLGEKMINCNNMCTFLNGQQTVEDHIKRYINDPVEDSTYDKNDFEEKMDFDDYLQSFNLVSFLELAKEKHKQSLWTKTKNAVHILKALLLDTTPEVPNDEVVYPVLLDERFDAHHEREANRRINGRTHSDRNAFKNCCKCDRTVDVTHTCQQCKMDFCELCRQQHITETKSHSLVASNAESFEDGEDNLDLGRN